MHTSPMRKYEGIIYLVGFIGSIWFANWLVTHWGTVRFGDGPWVIPVWPGGLTPSGNPIYAPSGVLAIGVGFTLRDLVQRRLGVKVAIVAIVVGTLLSAALDPSLALASGVAFLLAETLDLVVYTPLQRRHLGQVIGKAWMTLVAIPVVRGIRELDRQREIAPFGTDSLAR